MILSGKKALVTGGAARIGQALCLALADAGCDVVVHYRRSRRAAEDLAARIRRQGHRAVALSADLTRPADCRRLIAAARRKLGGLDILVNNAAVFNRRHLRDTDAAVMRQTWAVNLAAPLLLTRYFAAQANAGCVINLLDQRIVSNRHDALAYSLSKKALADATAMAALELAPGIAVNGIAPGPVLLPRRPGEREPAGVLPLQRRPTPADLAAALLFLLGSDVITGQVIYVDGGQHLLGSPV